VVLQGLGGVAIKFSYICESENNMARGREEEEAARLGVEGGVGVDGGGEWSYLVVSTSSASFGARPVGS